MAAAGIPGCVRHLGMLWRLTSDKSPVSAGLGTREKPLSPACGRASPGAPAGVPGGSPGRHTGTEANAGAHFRKPCGDSTASKSTFVRHDPVPASGSEGPQTRLPAVPPPPEDLAGGELGACPACGPRHSAPQPAGPRAMLGVSSQDGAGNRVSEGQRVRRALGPRLGVRSLACNDSCTTHLVPLD